MRFTLLHFCDPVARTQRGRQWKWRVVADGEGFGKRLFHELATLWICRYYKGRAKLLWRGVAAASTRIAVAPASTRIARSIYFTLASISALFRGNCERSRGFKLENRCCERGLRVRAYTADTHSLCYAGTYSEAKNRLRIVTTER